MVNLTVDRSKFSRALRRLLVELESKLVVNRMKHMMHYRLGHAIYDILATVFSNVHSRSTGSRCGTDLITNNLDNNDNIYY